MSTTIISQIKKSLENELQNQKPDAQNDIDWLLEIASCISNQYKKQRSQALNEFYDNRDSIESLYPESASIPSRELVNHSWSEDLAFLMLCVSIA